MPKIVFHFFLLLLLPLLLLLLFVLLFLSLRHTVFQAVSTELPQIHSYTSDH